MATMFGQGDRGWWKQALWTVPLFVGVGFWMGQLSNSGYGNNWFDGLLKPTFMPPGWLFGVAWTILYILLGIVLAMVIAARPSPARRRALMLFWPQMLLNFAWSPVFFLFHDMRLALVILVVMIVLTVGTVKAVRQIRPLAAGLMLPYLGWLVFAAMLNSATLNLNPGANVSLLGL